MESNLEYLLHLCYLKNELNRRRRRFFYHIRYGSSEFMTKYEARRGYRKAQTDMRAMTPEMRILSKALNVKIWWNSSGFIKEIEIKEIKHCIGLKSFKSHHESWLADKALELT